MLESKLGTHVLAKCLSDPENAPDVVRSCKESILRSDLNILISTSSDCPSSAVDIIDYVTGIGNAVT